MCVKYLTPANLGRISLRVRVLSIGLISNLLGLAGSRHIHILPFAFDTMTKPLPHSDVSFTTKGTIICCFCNQSRSSLRGCLRAYAILLGGTYFSQLPSPICNLIVPSKHPIPEKSSLKSLWIFFAINWQAFFLPLCLSLI